MKCRSSNTAGVGLALVLIAAAGSAVAGEKTVEVEGFGAIVKGNQAIARDRAIDDAKRKAVEQVAGTTVSSESITQNFQLVEDRIYSRASGFVKNYQVVSELKEQDVYRVKIKATVNESALASDLQMLFKTKPRVIVMIAEQNIGSKGFSYWWGSSGFVSDMDIMRNTLIQQWQPRGFKFIDPGLLSDNLQVKGPMAQAGLTNSAAIAISRDADADVAIVGKVLVSDAGPVMDGVKMHSYHAVGTLRVLNVDTGEIIAVADDTGVAPHIDPNIGGRAAIKALARKIGETVETKILKKWTAEAAGSREIEVVARKAKSSKTINELKRVIKNEVRGVESISLRRRKAGSAYFTVRVRASANDFGRDVEAKSYQNFKVEVVDVTKSKIVLSVNK